jgi:hypothetical protein
MKKVPTRKRNQIVIEKNPLDVKEGVGRAVLENTMWVMFAGDTIVWLRRSTQILTIISDGWMSGDTKVNLMTRW